MVLIESTTSAATSDKFPVTKENLPVTLLVGGSSAGEAFPVQFSIDAGATFEDLYVAGAQITLSNTNKVISIYAPMVLKVSKPTTLNPVTVIAIINGYTNGVSQ